MNILTPISPGEFFDKLTILVNKIYLCKNKHDLRIAIEGICQLLDNGAPSIENQEWVDINESLLALRDVNKVLWNKEEEVRITTKNSKRLEISDQIRELNSQRSEIKNQINYDLDGIQEMKDYESSKMD